MKLLTAEQYRQLLTNGRAQAKVRGTDAELDLTPVVKLFTPDAGCCWLLTELEPDDPDIAWGLCDLGVGFPEFGTVSLTELASVRGKLGLPIERDRHWTATAPISKYIKASDEAGTMVDHLPTEAVQ